MVFLTKENKLLDEFNLSLDCLDYKYIESCRNIKEIEKILKVLRSGEVGLYPDLVKFCENRLCKLCPGNKLLVVNESASHMKQLSLQEQRTLRSEIKNWEDEIKDCSADLQIIPERLNMPIRAETNIIYSNSNKENSKRKKEHSNANKFKLKGKPMSFAELDKFDEDKELKNIDKEDVKKLEKSCEEPKENVPLSPLNIMGLSEKEKQRIAEKERIKGNEAFKLGDYTEAELYYSRSICTFPTVAALNNRAFTNYKLEKFTASILDYNTLLIRDPGNVKALYRRGLVYRDTGRPQLAFIDFSSVLDINPENKLAKEEILKLDIAPVHKNHDKNKLVVIEELSEVEHFDPCENTASEDSIINQSTDHNSATAIKSTSCILKEEELSDYLSPKTIEFLDISRSKTSGKNQELIKVNEQPLIWNSPKAKDEEVVVRIEDLSENPCYDENNINLPVGTVTKQLVKISEKDHIENYMRNIPGSNNDETAKGIVALKANSQNISPSSEYTVPCDVVISARTDPLETGENDNTDSDKCVAMQEYLQKKYKEKVLEISWKEVSPYKFQTLWHNLNADRDAEIASLILKNIVPEEMVDLLSNQLDANFLCSVLKAVYILSNTGEIERAYKIMLSLTKTLRFKTVLSFLIPEEKKEIRNLFMNLKKCGFKDVHCLEELYTESKHN